jgi:hypothetical protein
MPDGPTDAIHLPEVTRPIFFGDSFKPAQPFTAGETELIDKRMWHASSSVLVRMF